MELDLQSYLGSCVQLYSFAEIPQLPPSPPAFGLIYEGTIGRLRYTTSLCNPLVGGITVHASLFSKLSFRSDLIRRMHFWIAFYIIYFLCLTCCVGLQGSALSGFLQVRSAAALSPVSTESCHMCHYDK
jgi:hypothetical protein